MNFWHDKLIIKNMSFPRFIGGPLDGITDSPFRQLVREFSQEELLFTEMRHVANVVCDKHERALQFKQLERPLNFQISANSLDFIPQACEKILAAGVDMVDLNIGCPSPTVTKSGSGSALMANPQKLKEIVTLLRNSLPIPFTVKMRAGYKTCNALDIAKLMEDCGVDAITVHPRLQTQKFEGRPDYALVAQVKKSVSIPVIISGGVINWPTAKLVYEQTGADGFLIGRGMWSKPWKLYELQQLSQGNTFLLDYKTIVRYALKHLDGLMDYYGPRGLFNFRKHIPFYIRGLPEASQLRQLLVVAPQVDEVKDGLLAYFNKYDTNAE